MKICAITMVYRDYWALSQWYAHYGRHLGEDNLFVVAHGSDPVVQTLCPKASVITVPRDKLAGFDRVRGDMLNALQSALGQVYDWVIRTDADELICFDPARYTSLEDVMARQGASALFALGLNMVEMDDDPALQDNEPVLRKRSNAVFSGHYSKAWAVRNGILLTRHGIRVRPIRAADFEFVLEKGVFLAHLKFANRASMTEVNEVRQAVTQSDGRGLPGKSWRYADERAAEYFQDVADMPVTDWDVALAMVFERLRTPVRNLKDGRIRVKSLRFRFRTVLPDWFKKC